MDRLYTAGVASNAVLVCWLVWGAYWIISSRTAKQKAERQSAASRAAYLLFTVLAFVLLMSDTSRVYLLQIRVVPPTFAFALSGALLCILGTSFTLWARRIIADNWSSDVAFKKEHELVEKGPYSIVRHPIYTGMLIMFLGTAIVGGAVAQFVAFVLVCVGFWIKIKQEESLLAAHFPNEYPAYQKRTRRIIPFIL
ncbi:MAG: methyltransferase family protein [Candidatus Acidiferrales bacterium]